MDMQNWGKNAVCFACVHLLQAVDLHSPTSGVIALGLSLE